MTLKHLGATVVVALLAACANLGQTANTSVYGSRALFVGGLELATVYGSLPKCAPTAPAVCHDAAVLKTVQKSAHVADAALDAAEDVARNPALGKDAATTAAITADGAVKAFRAITDQLRVK